MVAHPESWPARRPELRPAAAAAAAGAALFLVSWGLLHTAPLDRHQIVDTGVYQRYGDAIVDDGLVPYRDFSLEYPPGALPVFVLPSLAPEGDYRAVFEAVMLACGLGTIWLVALTLALAGASLGQLLGATLLAGVAPLALGSVVLTRFDLWPALLTAGALAALAGRRERLGLGLLGLAVAAKLYPIVLVPLALVYTSRRRGARGTLAALAVFVAVLAAVLLPLALLAPHGVAASLERQTGRPLQIESLGSALLLAAHDAGSYEPTIVSSFGSQNLVGSLPDAVATLSTALQALAVVGVWVLFATRRGRTDELLAASGAAVAAFVAFGKVLSPQFLLWLVPLVALAAGSLAPAAGLLLLAALALTHLWFPARYWHLVGLSSGPVWLLVARDLVLVALVAVLAAATTRPRAGSRTA